MKEEEILISASGETKELVVLKDVSKNYGNLLALDRATFSIDEGEIFGYIGPNGAGKTTTIKILNGLISDFTGKLSVKGYSMPENRFQVHKMLGYLPQEVAFQEWRTVDHVLKTFGKLSGLRKEEIESRTEELLDLIGMSKERFRKVVHLSGGMVQKLGLVQALLANPKLLILDEPLAGLDPESRIQIKSILQDLGKKGTTIFFSSHILSDVQDVATKIGIISRGKIKKIGTLDELKSHFSVANDAEIVLSYDTGKWKELTLLEGVGSVEQLELNKINLHLDGKRGLDEVIHNSIKSLIARGCKIRSINPTTPSLDEVYLRYINEEDQ